ncbi:MAG TPA: flagellar motor switch protein FliN [Burkholderiales bacterium]|nr:flagellar motor switch protein FliN [Burkholderiales bacterium]
MADDDVKAGVDAWAPLGSQAGSQSVSSSAAGSGARVFPELTTEPGARGAAASLDIVMDIPVQLSVELGRTRLPIRTLVQLAQGSVVELDRLAGEPLDVLVNGCLIAQGEVVVVNDKLGIRLTEVIGPDERLRRLQR